MFLSSNMMEAIAKSTPSNPVTLYRLYNMLAKKYFPSDMPMAGRDVVITAHPLQVQRAIGGAWHHGIDANGMTVSSENHNQIEVFLNSFLIRYPRLLFITMAHEMCHVYCHYKLKQTKDIRWLDDHGPRFHKVVASVIAKGLEGIKPSQDICTLPHSYPVVQGYALGKEGFVYLRLEDYTELNMNVLSQFSAQCDTSQPYYIGESNSSIVGIFPFVDRGKIQGDFFAYMAGPELALRHVTPHSWNGDQIK